MTAKEKWAYEKQTAYVRELEAAVHRLNCDAGDYADAVCELKFRMVKGDDIDSALAYLIALYDEKRRKD